MKTKMIYYDQHFLNNSKELTIISNALKTTNDDTIVEIGPGKGSLTNYLVDKHYKYLVLIEKDESLKKYLEKFHSKQLTIIYNTILQELDKYSYAKIIGNIPYAITEPLYKKVLNLRINQAVLLHGIDFYNTIMNNQSKWHYIIPAFYFIEKITTINGDQFIPKTKVTSVVVRLTLKESISKKDLFWQNYFLKESRSMKNTLIYSLVDAYGYSKKQATNLINDEYLDFFNKKTSQISQFEFSVLLELLEKKKII